MYIKLNNVYICVSFGGMPCNKVSFLEDAGCLMDLTC